MSKPLDLSQIEFIEELKEQWLAMIDAIADPLCLIDNSYTILRQNKAYLEQADVFDKNKYKSLIGKKCYEVFAKRNSPCSDCQVSKLSQNHNEMKWETHELIPQRKYEISAHTQLRNVQGKMYFVVHYRDVTEQRKLSQAVAQSEKLAAVGKLASGVAHELNSPLAGILAFAQILLSEIDEKSTYHHDIKQIELGAKKCKKIIEELLKLARLEHDEHKENSLKNSENEKDRDEKKEIDVWAELEGTIELINGFAKKHNVNIYWEKSTMPAKVIGSEGKLAQVFLNIITNSIQAMKMGGEICITSHFYDDKVQIVFSDTGEGIKPNDLPKIFDPFFTTKAVGEGTGLGLATSHAIIANFGGEIKYESVVGEGTQAFITLHVKN